LFEPDCGSVFGVAGCVDNLVYEFAVDTNPTDEPTTSIDHVITKARGWENAPFDHSLAERAIYITGIASRTRLGKVIFFRQCKP
jgi:hypothetical protein